MKLLHRTNEGNESIGISYFLIKSLPLKSPAFIFLVIALTVFAAEASVMLLLHFLPKVSFQEEAFVDATLLVIIISPALYFYLFRPMVTQISARQNSEQRFRTLADAAFEGVAITAQGELLDINDQLTRMLGYEPHELIGQQLTNFIPQEDRDRVIAKIKTGSEEQIEHEMLCKDGSRINVECHWQSMKQQGIPINLVAIRDITEHKRMDAIITRQANYDSLTGLSNRRMFRDLLEQEIKKAHRSRHNLALMFIDLDRFKDVNDKLGHHVGDKLLVQAAKRIVACVRETDTVSRLGGDEFTVILSEMTDVNHIENVAHAIIQSLSQPYELGEEGIFISASIGITIYPTDATNPDDLLRNADQAMYSSKSEGRNCFHFFTGEMQEATRKRHQLAKDLYSAMEGDQFQVYFQPIVDLRSGGLFKAEALLRWQHPVRGMISPAEFIPVAEDIGIIDEISDWVFKESLEQGKRWTKLTGQSFRVGVNISPVQFRAKNNKWIKQINATKLMGAGVSIEITEGTLLNDRPEIVESLHAVHEAGVEVAIDDFGTGHSSLSYLQKFKIDYLKIDQSFTRNLTTDSTELALTEAIIAMAHKLGMKVIAEGIESAAQRDLLAAAGCDFGQGYLFSRPVPGKEFEKLLQTGMIPNRPQR